MKKISLLFLVFCSFASIAQDKIIKNTGDVINCEVSEVGANEVKYFYKDKPNIVFGLDKALIEKIEFASGEVMKIESNSFKEAGYYADQSKHALKLNFLSPLWGSTEIIYEQSVTPGQSWEVALGIVGLGFDPQEYNPAGFYSKFAYKFIRTPDFYVNNMHYAHILKGAYFAPEIALRIMKYDAYKYDYYYYSSSQDRKDDFAVALTLKFGKQWVFDDSFLVDVYCGFGYGYSEASEDGDVVNYGFIVGAAEIPFSATAGLRVGWVF